MMVLKSCMVANSVVTTRENTSGDRSFGGDRGMGAGPWNISSEEITYRPQPFGARD